MVTEKEILALIRAGRNTMSSLISVAFSHEQRTMKGFRADREIDRVLQRLRNRKVIAFKKKMWVVL